MRKDKIDGVLYMETTPEAWAADTIKNLGLLPDLETIYVPVVTKEMQFEIFLPFHNKRINFSLETKSGRKSFSGVFLEVWLPNEEKRNKFDVLFIPLENLEAFRRIEDNLNTGFKKEDFEKRKVEEAAKLALCHLINIGTMTDVELI